MRRTAVVVAGGGLVLGLAACGGSSGATPGAGAAPSGSPQHPSQLVGTVGHNDAFDIGLTDGQGHAITNLAAGTYPLTVHDESSIHDFHLTGAGVNDATSVSGAETKNFQVTFKPGTYTFLCDTHPTQMHGTFHVT